MRRILVASCALALVLGGCGRDGDPAEPRRTVEPQTTASSPSAQAPAKDSEACTLLNAKDRRSIAGEKLEIIAPTQQTDDVLKCRWVTTLSTPAATSLEIVAQPAPVWAQIVPFRVDQMIQAGQAEDFAKELQRAKAKVLRGVDQLSGKDACDMFSLLVEVNDDKKGATQFIQYQGGGAGGGFIVYAHRCTRGVYTVLSYSEPELGPSLALSDAMVRLGGIAHKRAVDRL